MSSGWEGYKPAAIEVFHGEAMEEFHKGAEFKVNETFVGGVRYMNGIEFNRILTIFKGKIMREYGISSAPVKLDEK